MYISKPYKQIFMILGATIFQKRQKTCSIRWFFFQRYIYFSSIETSNGETKILRCKEQKLSYTL